MVFPANSYLNKTINVVVGVCHVGWYKGSDTSENMPSHPTQKAYLNIHCHENLSRIVSLPRFSLTYLQSWALPEKLPLCSHSGTSQHFKEPEGSSPCSQEPSTGPCPRLLVNFRNKLIFYGEELLAPRPTPKLEDHPLSAIRDCLFNIFAATLHIWRLSPPSATCGLAMPWWKGTHLTWPRFSLVS
jgi:hypothetical protein